MIGLFQQPEQFSCSRAGCSATAGWRIEWRNPKIHAEDRVKVWLACDDHNDYLTNFLAARDFPVTSSPLTPEAAP